MPTAPALRVVRVSAFYDLFVTAGFAFAPTAALIFGGLGALSVQLGLGGAVPDASSPLTMNSPDLTGQYN